MVLAGICLRSGSVLPGMLLHAVHNSLLLSASYFMPELEQAGWGVEEESHLPLAWLAAATIGAAAGGLMLAYSKPAEGPTSTQSA